MLFPLFNHIEQLYGNLELLLCTNGNLSQFRSTGRPSDKAFEISGCEIEVINRTLNSAHVNHIAQPGNNLAVDLIATFSIEDEIAVQSAAEVPFS